MVNYGDSEVKKRCAYCIVADWFLFFGIEIGINAYNGKYCIQLRAYCSRIFGQCFSMLGLIFPNIPNRYWKISKWEI